MNLLLCVLWTLLLVLGVVCRAFAPAMVLPDIDIPMILAVCLAALILERWRSTEYHRCWPVMAALSAATFGLLPLCAGMTGAVESLKVAIVGSGVFLVSGILFDSMAERISIGPHAGWSVLAAAFLLFLGAQGFTNIFF